MHISYFDDARLKERQLIQNKKSLQVYRTEIQEAEKQFNLEVPEASLYYAKDLALHRAVETASQRAKHIRLVILVGIGGSSLGVEAVHGILSDHTRELFVLDTVGVDTFRSLEKTLTRYKQVKQIAVCVVSKSGNTTETLANAAVLFSILEGKYGKSIYDQSYFIGNAGTEFMKTGKKLNATTVAMPEIIGGRYSIATAVGLIPLALLNYDVDEFLSGYLDVLNPTLESVVVDSAARITCYHQLRYPHYTFFAFEPRLEKLGRWYRQLFAESLGKAVTIENKPVREVMVPTIVTPVELHSVGQLFLSGVPKMYTDFVTFDDETLDVMIPKQTKIAGALKGYSIQEVATALYGGVIAAYQELQLPHRATIFEENLTYSTGQFMAMRLREVMYVAKLLKLNAFDQPNVELYKNKTKEILFL